MNVATVSAAVLLAVRHEEVPKLVAIADAGVHGSAHTAALGIVRGHFQAGRGIVLLIHRQRKGVHPIERLHWVLGIARNHIGLYRRRFQRDRLVFEEKTMG